MWRSSQVHRTGAGSSTNGPITLGLHQASLLWVSRFEDSLVLEVSSFWQHHACLGVLTREWRQQ
jgi:hypothetical protein